MPITDDILNLKQIKELENVDQNPKFHKEGNVLIHTKMTLDSLYKILNSNYITESASKNIIIASIFHDIGKTSTTIRNLNNELISPKHSLVGEKVTREILYKDFGEIISFNDREEIVKMVRYHGLPLNFLNKPDPKKSVIESSLYVNNLYLSILAEADVRGRICKDSNELLDKVELFREFCHENGCLKQKFDFLSDDSRFLYFNKNNNYLHFDPYNSNNFNVYLMSGLPGSGKDTYISKHLSQFPMVSLDEIRNHYKFKATNKQGRVIYIAKEQAKNYLRNEQSLVWNATNTTKFTRQKLIGLFTDYRAKVKIIYIESRYSDLLKRNGLRSEPLPKSKLEKLIKNLEVPALTEAHDVDYVLS